MLRFCVILVFVHLATVSIGAESELQITDITCRGNTVTRCDFIRSLLPFSIGDIVDSVQIADTRLYLVTLPYIKSANIYLEKGATRNLVTVVVEIEETTSIQYESVYSGVQTDSGLQSELGFRIKHHNLLGYGKTLSLSTGLYDIPLDLHESRGKYFRLRYVDPNFVDSRNHFVSIYTQYLNGELITEESDKRETERWSTNITLGQRLWNFSYLTLGYINLFEGNVSFEDGNGDLQYRQTSASVPIALPAGKAEFDLAQDDSFYLTFGWNTEDHPYHPSTGSKFNVSWTPSDNFERKLAFFYQYNKASQLGGTWSFTADRPNSNGPILESNPTDASRYRAIFREQYSIAYTSPLFLPNSRNDQSYWQLNLGATKSLGDDDLAPSIGVDITLSTIHFGLINLNFRYVDDK